jgi:hypothetical protein
VNRTTKLGQPGSIEQRRVGRRAVVRTALAGVGGLAASGLLPPAAGEAYAAPADPRAGPAVTPNPIGAPVRPSGLAVELLDFCAPPRTSAAPPYAHLNFLYHAGDGSGFVYACDGRGRIWRIDPAGMARLFLDVKKARAGALLFIMSSGRSTTGLRSFAFHPDFARAGRRGFGKLYTATTETAGSYLGGDVPLFSDPAYPVHSHCVVAEWGADPADPARVDPATRREVLRAAVYKDDHNIDQLMFDPNLRPGQAGYGAMYVGVGDGGNVPSRPDPYNQAQNLGRALGKILRINPLRQPGGKPYGIPADNPFVGRAGALPEIWAYGLRHPLNMSFDTGGNGALIITDIGQEHVEEVNLGVKGANYGWPEREGTYVTDRRDGTVLYAPPADDTARGFTFPVAQYDHYEGGRGAVGDHRRLRLPRHRGAGAGRAVPVRRPRHRPGVPRPRVEPEARQAGDDQGADAEAGRGDGDAEGPSRRRPRRPALRPGPGGRGLRHEQAGRGDPQARAGLRAGRGRRRFRRPRRGRPCLPLAAAVGPSRPRSRRTRCRAGQHRTRAPGLS